MNTTTKKSEKKALSADTYSGSMELANNFNATIYSLMFQHITLGSTSAVSTLPSLGNNGDAPAVSFETGSNNDFWQVSFLDGNGNFYTGQVNWPFHNGTTDMVEISVNPQSFTVTITGTGTATGNYTIVNAQ